MCLSNISQTFFSFPHATSQGPPCSSWVYLSRSSTGRCCLRPKGSNKNKKVRAQNRLVRRLCYALEFAFRRGLFYAVEQPASSLMPEYKPFKKLLRRHGAVRVHIYLGAFGAPTLKPVVIWTTSPFLRQLGEVVTVERRDQLRSIRSQLNLKLVRRYVDKRGDLRVDAWPFTSQEPF
ncbi:unnamed protein product [Effrenium voratum]|uniref:Uncharacterized protein n=1 Tax=Effrenium voratum TaxID=2562239 RepID=A0AA36J8L9_9DINO|nr:unnamed protein product [Effrenium voratum]